MALDVTARTAVSILITLIGGVANFSGRDLVSSAHHETARKEQQNLKLVDGSIVQLNESSVVDVSVHPFGRRVRLDKGEARFNVAKDPVRPFTVETPDVTIRVTGTIFNVRADGRGSEVVVLEGHVEVTRWPVNDSSVDSGAGEMGSASRSSKLSLSAGSSAYARYRGALIQQTRIDARNAIAQSHRWPRFTMSFDEKPLGEVVAEFNQYHERPVYFADSELASQPVSGILNVYDRGSLLQMLRLFGVDSEEDADGILWLSVKGSQHGGGDEQLLRRPQRKR